jgi:hypothetical protein
VRPGAPHSQEACVPLSQDGVYTTVYSSLQAPPCLTEGVGLWLSAHSALVVSGFAVCCPPAAAAEHLPGCVVLGDSHLVTNTLSITAMPLSDSAKPKAVVSILGGLLGEATCVLSIDSCVYLTAVCEGGPVCGVVCWGMCVCLCVPIVCSCVAVSVPLTG